MRQVIAVPSPQGAVTVVFEQGLQPWAFHVTIAEYHVGLSSMPSGCPPGAAWWEVLTKAGTSPQARRSISDESAVAYESLPYGHHIGGAGDLRITDGLVYLEW